MKLKIYESNKEQDKNYKLLMKSLSDGIDKKTGEYNNETDFFYFFKGNVFDFLNNKKNEWEELSNSNLPENGMISYIIDFLNYCDKYKGTSIINIYKKYIEVQEEFEDIEFDNTINQLRQFIGNNFNVMTLKDKIESFIFLYSKKDGINYLQQFIKDELFMKIDDNYFDKDEYSFIDMVLGELQFNSSLFDISSEKFIKMISDHGINAYNSNDELMIKMVEKDIINIKKQLIKSFDK